MVTRRGASAIQVNNLEISIAAFIEKVAFLPPISLILIATQAVLLERRRATCCTTIICDQLGTT
ncbi:hypothetical protein DU000_11435 [Parvibium lacunae]|uniref:Uncharacterized protein n=1 Tax=Parvibium lacunae TaxID=1888893 RepID=A0A368KZX3_9BURK|nr:hypothetical protein DU000_11435 [Parvibium lacunae]